MVIVPSNGQLVAEVKLLNRDIGFVRPGQDVALKVEAFPFTRYGAVQGKLLNVGMDAVEDEKLGLVYPARVAFERRPMGKDGRVIALVPGMSVTADAQTGRRTILSYLLSPIDETVQEAGRER